MKNLHGSLRTPTTCTAVFADNMHGGLRTPTTCMAPFSDNVRGGPRQPASENLFAPMGAR